MSDELFQLSNGRYITSEDISRKLYYIKDHHPETAYQDDSTGYSWDEAGMADLFSECYQNDTRYCPEAKSWYTYETGKWHKDVGALLVSAKIKEFVRLMALYCGEITDEEKRKQYMAFVGKMGDRRFRDRLMKDAADSMKIAAAQFDTHPYLINCLNGTYDLEHMKFREHRWDDFLTMQTNFEYMAIGITKEQAWEWENVVKGNPARSDFIKKVRQFCGVFREGLMQDGKVNPVTGIFWQKNYDGMKDQTEMVLTPNNPLGEQKDMKALEQKYLESAYDGSEVAEGTFTEIAESSEGAEGQKD